MAVLVTAYLVGGFKDFQTFFIFHFIYGLILPIDYCNILSRWLNHQPGIDDMYIYIIIYIYMFELHHARSSQKWFGPDFAALSFFF